MERVQAVACLTEALEEQKNMYGAVRIAEIIDGCFAGLFQNSVYIFPKLSKFYTILEVHH